MHPKRDLVVALVHDIEQIEDNSKLFHAGRSSAYQAIAIQLRNLLLDGRRGLFTRALPDALLHQLRPPRPLPEPSSPTGHIFVAFDARGRFRMPTANSRGEHELDFCEGLALVSVEQWLEQWLFRPDITIRQLINDTANEEVAHTEDRVGKKLAAVPAIQWEFHGPPDEHSPARLAIVALGDYIAGRVRELIA